MKVYVINPEITMINPEEARIFYDILNENLDLYGVLNYKVENSNVLLLKNQLDSDSLIVLFNDESDTKIDANANLKKFLDKANQNSIHIWPIAMDKAKRKPFKSISTKQSYDVCENLRIRDLDQNYLDIIAKAFSRKVISEVMPTIYNENGLIFFSHRRIDGEDITANLYDRIKLQIKDSNVFRDVPNVEVGQEAQSEIYRAMAKSDAFVFIHTPKSSESDWIKEELKFAILHNIPILWVQIDNADSNSLILKPSENPHLKCDSAELYDSTKIIKIAENVIQKIFDLIMLRNNSVYDWQDTLFNLFGDNLKVLDNSKMIYSIDIRRKGYKYPQRNICQYIQLFGRTPIDDDKNKFFKFVNENSHEIEYDSRIILTDKILNIEIDEKNVIETYENFFYRWQEYMYPQTKHKGREIVISGAFPDGDELNKQNLTNALIIFSKSILKAGYTLTFGSHPTFQELFFEIAKQVCPETYQEKLKMYISQWFEDKYIHSKEDYELKANFCETSKAQTIEKSLTIMRKQMIQRKEVSALICLGGKIKKDKSKEGIREEIALAQEYDIPVFIVGSVGGCSSKIAMENYNSLIGLKKISNDLNKEFKESIDYFYLSQKMLCYLDDILRKV